MKKIHIVAIIIFCVSCQNKKESILPDANRYDELLTNKEKCSIDDIDFIFGLKAGMSESEVDSILYANSSITVDMNGHLCVPLDIEGALHQVKGIIYRHYNNGKLRRLFVLIKSESIPLTNGQLWRQICKAYKNEYGVDYYVEQTNANKAAFIFKNKHIDISTNDKGDVFVAYEGY